MLKRKSGKIEEQLMHDIPDEQLGQVTGGSLCNDVGEMLGTVSPVATGLISSASVSGMQVSVAGASCTTPAVSPNSLLPGLV